MDKFNSRKLKASKPSLSSKETTAVKSQSSNYCRLWGCVTARAPAWLRALRKTRGEHRATDTTCGVSRPILPRIRSDHRAQLPLTCGKKHNERNDQNCAAGCPQPPLSALQAHPTHTSRTPWRPSKTAAASGPAPELTPSRCRAAGVSGEGQVGSARR